MRDTFYVTTPIYYVNGAPHIGHAYTTVVADALRRFHSLRGRRARFLTGTDEHGLKIEREAAARGMKPLDFATENADRFRALWPLLGVAPDDFIRTTEARHIAGVQKWWQTCAARGDIYLGRYKGLYCVACEGYKTEKELLDGGLCPVHERPVETLEEETYFFRLSKYQDALLKLFRETSFIQPETRRNEMIAFVEQGLEDLSISRTSFEWGIKVPGDPRHVVYVWFDALFNYRTALEADPALEAFWPPTVQLVAKDIVRFHTVYWPAFLMSAGLPLPETVFSHGYLLSAGRKTSKTPGQGGPAAVSYTTNPAKLVDALGADVLRYYLLRDVVFGNDSEFQVPNVIARARAELAETVGNLLNRTLPFVTRVFDGRVPSVDAALCGEREAELVAHGARVAVDSGALWETFAHHRAIELCLELARLGNQYFDTQAPWKLAKSEADRARLGTVIAHVLAVVRTVATMLAPVIPVKAAAMLGQLGLQLEAREGHDAWPAALTFVPAGTAIAPGEPVFLKYDAQTEAELLAALKADEPAAATPAAPEAPKVDAPVAEIAFDDFAKVDLRLGTVLSAEKVPKKDMLLKLSVDLGEAAGPRTIVSGIALAYKPEALVGKQVVVVANLAPRDFGKGLVSHGMLLACGPKESLGVATFDRAFAPGTRVK